jgi:low molecular weight protein-tyrosine phosphatase
VAGLDVAVTSFGTLDQRGAPALLPAIRAARAFGIDLRGHRARVLEPGLLEDADLVVGFESSHVASAVVIGGAVTSRVFLLTELAGALSDVLPGATPGGSPVNARFAELVESADALRRSVAGRPRPVADPAGRSDRRFVEVYREIDVLVAVVAGTLFGTGIQRTG